MAKLVYSAITSLDGYIADAAGNFDWATPDAEVFAFIIDQERAVGTVLYGRRMYETMVFWETFDGSEDEPYETEFAEIWRGASKVVFSRSLVTTSSAKTRLETAFEPESIQRLKRSLDHDMSIGGADLARQAISAGLVDELHLFITPVTVGGGTSAYPEHLRTNLELLGLDTFGSGVVHLHYRVNPSRVSCEYFLRETDRVGRSGDDPPDRPDTPCFVLPASSP